MTKHTILGGDVHIYQRENSGKWQCSTYLNGKNHRTSTKERSLARAKDFAEDWYLELRGKHKRGELQNEKTFKFAAQKFLDEYAVILADQRSPKWIKDHEGRIRLHLNPFFGKLPLSQVTSGAVQDYRAHRIQGMDGSKPPSRSTLHTEIVTLRQIMKTAQRHGWISYLPDFSAPYKTSGKIVHRAWFSHDE